MLSGVEVLRLDCQRHGDVRAMRAYGTACTSWLLSFSTHALHYWPKIHIYSEITHSEFWKFWIFENWLKISMQMLWSDALRSHFFAQITPRGTVSWLPLSDLTSNPSQRPSDLRQTSQTENRLKNSKDLARTAWICKFCTCTWSIKKNRSLSESTTSG